MERLTKNINGQYITNCNANICYIDSNESIFMGNAIDKLAQFEDFMEANGFEDIQELQNALNGGKDRWQKLKELLEKDVEHNLKEYDESYFLEEFLHYAAAERWVLERMEELEKEIKQ